MTDDATPLSTEILDQVAELALARGWPAHEVAVALAYGLGQLARLNATDEQLPGVLRILHQTIDGGVQHAAADQTRIRELARKWGH